MPQFRFWELLAGSVLAHINFFNRTRFLAFLQRWTFHPVFFSNSPTRLRQQEILNNFLWAVGFILIVTAFFLISKNKPFPGWWALLPVSGAFLIILAGPEAWGNRVILAGKLLVYIGLISYPLYLWHWPLLSFARIIEGELPSWEIRVGLVLLSFLLAWLTYIFIEKPIRFGSKTRRKTAIMVLFLLIVAFVGWGTHRKNGFEFRTEQFQKVMEASGDWGYPGKLTPVTREGLIDYYILQSGLKRVTLFVGDSNIEQYFPRVEALIESDPTNTSGVIFKTGGGCLSIPDQSHVYKHCSLLMVQALRIVKEKPEIDTIVIGSLWNRYLAGGAAMTKKFGAESAEYADALIKLSDYIKELRAMNKRVFILLNIPIGEALDPKYMAKRDLKAFPNLFSVRSGGVPKIELESAYGRIQADLAKVAANAGAIVINPMDYLCEANCFSVDSEGAPIYKDQDHLRPKYVREKAYFIDVTLR